MPRFPIPSPGFHPAGTEVPAIPADENTTGIWIMTAEEFEWFMSH